MNMFDTCAQSKDAKREKMQQYLLYVNITTTWKIIYILTDFWDVEWLLWEGAWTKMSPLLKFRSGQDNVPSITFKKIISHLCAQV